MALAPGTEGHRKFYAQFANAAYNPKNPIVPEGWEIDPALSNRNRQVFVNHVNRESVVAFRGTNPKNYGDLSTDLLLALNMREFSSRFKNATRTAKQARDKYSDYRMTLTGHSLGASQATHAFNKLRGSNNGTISLVGYSTHTPTTDIQRQAIRNLSTARSYSKNAAHYGVAYDPVSTGTFLSGNFYNVKQTARDPHSLANFM